MAASSSAPRRRSILFVGVFAVLMTRRDGPLGVTPCYGRASAVLGTVGADPVGRLAGSASNPGRRFANAHRTGRCRHSLLLGPTTPRGSNHGMAEHRVAGRTVDHRTPRLAVVTPSVPTTRASPPPRPSGRIGLIEAVVPSGAIVRAELRRQPRSGVALVDLPGRQPTTRPSVGDSLSTTAVLAYGDEFDVSGRARVAGLAVPEGAPL